MKLLLFMIILRNVKNHTVCNVAFGLSRASHVTVN